MITSGILIGQIIDDLSNIVQQAKIRNQLGHTDLSVFCENFFMKILNETLDLSLKNTNKDRANEPGIDLADEYKKTAFQVTTTKTSAKVINTLAKITPEQRNLYRNIYIFIVGDKQDKYEAVTNALNNRSKKEQSVAEVDREGGVNIHEDIIFEPNENIMDLTDLFRKIVGLDLVRIQKIHAVVQQEGAKVKIELQVPDEDGKFQTEGYQLWEPKQKQQLGGGVLFSTWEAAQGGNKPSQAGIDLVKKDIEHIASKLNSLPRITREFLAALYERANYKRERFAEHPSVFLNVVKKTYLNSEEEISLLLTESLISIDYEKSSERHLDPEIGLNMYLPHKSTLDLSFYDFVTEKNLSFRDVIGNINFSAF